jgi:hypothetical protein
MKLKCLACEALARPVYLCAARSPHIVDVELYRIGLHREPDDLRARLQARIDAASQEEWDAVVMVYGLCGQSTAGLVARGIPLVLPRAHDCITLYLGSRERYNEQFTEHPGTYWYTLDYRERATSGVSLSADVDAQTQATYEEYVRKYGEDNAEYLMEVMGAWQAHYDRAAFIDMGVGDGSAVEAQTQEDARQKGWRFERLVGDLVLVRRLLDGDWEDDFVVIQPGQQAVMTYDGGVIDCKQPDEGERIAGRSDPAPPQ